MDSVSFGHQVLAPIPRRSSETPPTSYYLATCYQLLKQREEIFGYNLFILLMYTCSYPPNGMNSVVKVVGAELRLRDSASPIIIGAKLRE